MCDTSCPIGKLPFSFLLCGEFLKTNFRSMPQLWKYVSIRPNERFRKVLQSWSADRTYICCDRLRRGYKLTFMSAISSHLVKERSLRVLNELHLGKEKPVVGNIEPLLGITKPTEGLNKPCQGNVNGRKSIATEGFNVKIPFISQTYTTAVGISC